MTQMSWEKIKNQDGGRYTVKHHTLPKNVSLFQTTTEGLPLQEKMDTYKNRKVVEHTYTRNVIDDNTIEFIVEAFWKNKDDYNEFEQWYKSNFRDIVDEYNKKNNIIHQYKVEIIK